MPATFPQSARQTRAPSAIPCSHVALKRQWWWVLLSVLFPPPFDTFSHSSCSQFNCYPIGSAGCPPSVNQGNKGLPPPSPSASFMKTALMVSFLLFLFFPHHSKFSTSIFFSATMVFRRLHQPPSLSQSSLHLIFTNVSCSKLKFACQNLYLVL